MQRRYNLAHFILASVIVLLLTLEIEDARPCWHKSEESTIP